MEKQTNVLKDRPKDILIVGSANRWIDRQRNGEVNRPINRKMYRQFDRQIDRQIDGQIDR